MMPSSVRRVFFFSLLSLLLLLLSPTLATPSSSSSSSVASSSDGLDHDLSNNDRPSANYSYQPPALQQQHVFAVDSSSSSLLVQNSNNLSATTMCNKATSNPNRVVLPANVTPSHYTLSIVPDLKEFTFGGQVAIE